MNIIAETMSRPESGDLTLPIIALVIACIAFISALRH